MATAAPLAKAGKLHTLRSPAEGCQASVDILLIPGIGSIAPEAWHFTKEAWLSDLPDSGKNVRVLAYEYASPFTSTKPAWESILMQGYDLLEQLNQRLVSGPYKTSAIHPIILVCHSIGGLIVKQALCVANKQFSRYGTVVNAVVGVVFLSTPHRYGDKTTSVLRFRDVLEATVGKSTKTLNTNTEQDGSILLDLADRFEGISLRTPILSVYELKESKFGSTALRSKYQQLVTREVCSTYAPLERVIGLNLSHHETCLFMKSIGGEGLSTFNAFLHEAIRGAVHLIAQRLEDHEYQYATTSAYSPSLSELHFEVEGFTSGEWPSNQATEGASRSGQSSHEMVHPSAPEPEARRKLNLPCCLLGTHPANEDFCGRESVLQILANELLPSKTTVTASNSALRQFAICGFGGIGKTEIAREFARCYKDTFDAVFWVMADETAKLDEHYQQISLALGLEDPVDCKSQVVSREIVKGWLSNPRKDLTGSDELSQPGSAATEATWLLVFDNADDPMILADYWPQGSGSILVTSRDPLAKSIFTRKASGMDLGPLTAQESLSMFTHLTAIDSETEDGTAGKISQALGGIPLAIAQMAGIIRRQDLTLEEFHELYTDHEEHAGLYETRFDTNLVSYPHSLSTVWAMEKLKPQGRRLADLLAFMDPDTVGEDLLMEAAADLLAERGTFKKSSYMEARADLLQSSLVQRNKQKQQVSIHRIVQDVVLSTMDTATKVSLFDHVAKILWGNWPSAMPKPSKEPVLTKPKSTGGRLHVQRWPSCAALYPHVLRMHQLWPTVLELSSDTCLLFAKLLTEAAWYQKERGQTKDFDGFFDTARKICEPSTHPDRDSILADLFFCLGAVAMDASDFGNSRKYKELSLELVLKICTEVSVEDERLYLAYAELGISRIQDGRYEEGEAALKEALRMRKALGSYIPRSGEANLSWALLAQGKLDECDTLLTESLAGREKALGKDDRESVKTGLILYVLGNLRAAQNNFDESYVYHQRALNHMRATVGERDFYTANTYHKMAEHLVRMGQSEDAIAMINKALDIWSVDPNSHKNEISRSTFFKAKLFETTDRTSKASIALRVASRLRKEITEEDRNAKSLTMDDFDSIIAFWAK